MLYFPHNELVTTFHISLKTIHNWVDATKQGKLNLQLHEYNGKTYIANTPGNIAIIERLSKEGKKYRNTRHRKVVTPAPAFYDIYSKRQILDIITNLMVHREIPSQYNYLDEGAIHWDSWLKRLEQEKTPNILQGTLELLSTNLSALDAALEGSKRINIIDLGAGNARPVKELLAHLLQKGQLHRYIAVDISPAMLKVAEHNIERWFDKKVHFEGHLRDISFERFDDLLVDDMLDKSANETINLVLLLGGTPTNFRSYEDVIKVVASSMGGRDLLVCTDKPDTAASRRYFDFNPKPGSSGLPATDRMILDLLNISPSLYDVEMGFHEQKRMRYIRIKLKTAITIKFEFANGERLVDLEKDETILLLRIWHRTTLEAFTIFQNIGFTLLHSNLTKDRQTLLTISSLESKSSL